MEGARASSQSFVPVAAEAPREGDGRAIVARRRWALSAVVVILAFAAAFAVGAATKTRTARQGAPQLAPATSARGAPSVGITAMQAASAVPHLTPAPVKSTQSSSRPSAGTQSQTTQSQTTQSQTTQSQTTQSQTPQSQTPQSHTTPGPNPSGPPISGS